MNVLITGGAGYVGVKLSEALLDRGENVTIFDNFMYGYDAILHLVNSPNLTVIKGDIRNEDYSYLKGQDVIFHLAALSGYPVCQANPHTAKMTNSLATQRLVAHLSRDQQIIYASTTSLYGNSGTSCDETTPVKPVSLYGITKYEAERMVMEHGNTISLRFATIFGVSPRMRIDLLPNDFTYRAMTERCLVLFEYHARRTFLHIRDAIVAYLLALDNFETMKDNIYNVGDKTLNFSKLEIANAIKKYVRFEIVNAGIEDPDARNFDIDFSKISRLGYSATLSLDDGIKELIKLYGFYNPMPSAKNV